MPEEIVMAFDFGEKRIGVAVGNTVTARARPLTTLHVQSNQDRLAAVGKLVAEWQPARFVIGEPTYGHDEAGGEGHPIAHLARKFGNRLTENFRLPVEYVNEFLSSAAAEQLLNERGIKGLAQKEHVDAVAAQIILQNYLDDASRHAA
ncbi:MAG: Holliday junction resolvase RuvX [Betaproteobacteria bacterium]